MKKSMLEVRIRVLESDLEFANRDREDKRESLCRTEATLRSPNSQPLPQARTPDGHHPRLGRTFAVAERAKPRCLLEEHHPGLRDTPELHRRGNRYMPTVIWRTTVPAMLG